MSEKETKHGNRNEDSVMRPDGPEEKEDQGPGPETGMDDRAAEFVFRIFRDQNAEGDPPAAVGQWTAFLSACKSEWTLSPAGDADNLEPAVRVMRTGMIHTGMGVCTQDIWLDVQDGFTVERGEYLNLFSGRMNNPHFGTNPEHPTLLVSPIPSGDDPLDEIIRKADDRMFSFRWLDGTHFRAFPCMDRDGSLLICDLKHMGRVDPEQTNAALIAAGKSTQ